MRVHSKCLEAQSRVGFVMTGDTTSIVLPEILKLAL